jgi:hypothetical protein
MTQPTPEEIAAGQAAVAAALARGRRRVSCDRVAGAPLLNEITEALKAHNEIVLTDDQKSRLTTFLKTATIRDEVTGKPFDGEISGRTVRVLRGKKPGAGLVWRFE